MEQVVTAHKQQRGSGIEKCGGSVSTLHALRLTAGKPRQQEQTTAIWPLGSRAEGREPHSQSGRVSSAQRGKHYFFSAAFFSSDLQCSHQAGRRWSRPSCAR
jgi:hypothetical protein